MKPTERKRESSGTRPVIEHGYCVGCGVCAALPNSGHEIALTPYGTLSAKIVGPVSDQGAVARVCPFSDEAVDENVLGAALFPAGRKHDHLGSIHSVYAGHVIADGFRQRGSSGGMGSWLLEQLLVAGHVDGVVHVAETSGAGDDSLFAYRIVRSVDDLRSGAKSRYYPVTLTEVVAQIRAQPGRYAFSGVPCFIKAIRLLAREDKQFGASVGYCIGLVCGHLKSRGFAEFLAWQMGVAPHELVGFDFRVKMPGRAANRYGAKAVRANGSGLSEHVRAMQELYGHDWGMGLFKLKSCDYCDDVVAETADVTVGDAWLPRYVADSEGTNLIIVRNPLFDDILSNAAQAGTVHLETLTEADAVQSQSSGFSHRREGLAYRLWLADSRSIWRPLKRTQANRRNDDRMFERRQEARVRVAELSHEALLEAKQSGSLAVFFRRIVPAVEHYRDFSRTPWRRLAVRAKRLLLGDPLVKRALQSSKSKS
ncbi:Coenzyme F420 hydrogenase/dehydrogenase, beta subunit C-terminal domain [Parazoarcus communis]|uniref:Coenzyme F420 hydrogenase/dehydrogenase, beta subunit C-terminal domain n=1 Tax=Parazoarcus communis TaxID=41977 RepID=UPI001459B674